MSPSRRKRQMGLNQLFKIYLSIKGNSNFQLGTAINIISKCGKLFSHNYISYCCSELKVRITLYKYVHFRLLDSVMEVIESVQRSVRDIGDLLLDDIQLALIDENIAVEFIQNKEFLKTLTKEKLGYLKLREVLKNRI